MLPNEFRFGSTVLGVLQDPDDLLLAESALLHPVLRSHISED